MAFDFRPVALGGVALLFSVAWLLDCGSTTNGFEDSGSDSSAVDAPNDTQTADAGDGGCTFCSDAQADAPVSHKFFVLVTETPAGSPPLDQWGGILRYSIDDDFGPATEDLPIGPDAGVHDPLGLVFRYKSQELFVGNRHGNNAADGTAGSISRYVYSPNTETFTYNGEITGNGMGAISEVAFDPTESELYAANCCNGGNSISKFALDSNGVATADGSFGTNGILGIAIAPDGKRLYASQSIPQDGTIIRQFDLPSDTETSSVSVPGASRLHLMTLSGSDLYVGDIGGTVFRFSIGTNDDLTLVQSIPADVPISVALSPSGLELFATAHSFNQTSVIDRFMQTDGGAWSAEDASTKIVTPTSLGGTHVFPASGIKVIN